jgi:Uncharacterised protein family (UPF0160)
MLNSVNCILTHPGGAHKDEFLACCVLMAMHGVPVLRREPVQADLDDPGTVVVDVGGEHDPARGNFDHHQFSRESTPMCALSLVLKDLGLYEDARHFCDWLEPAEWFDCRGPSSTASWLGVDRRVVGQLSSPIDLTLVRRFASMVELKPGEVLYEVMRWVGEDLLGYLRGLRERLRFIGAHAQFWQIEGGNRALEVIFLPRTDSMSGDPSHGLPRFIAESGRSRSVVAMVYPDRRGAGYGLSRYDDHPAFDFRQISECEDVHFTHASGFLAKTSAADVGRLRELLGQAVA